MSRGLLAARGRDSSLARPQQLVVKAERQEQQQAWGRQGRASRPGTEPSCKFPLLPYPTVSRKLSDVSSREPGWSLLGTVPGHSSRESTCWLPLWCSANLELHLGSRDASPHVAARMSPKSFNCSINSSLASFSLRKADALCTIKTHRRGSWQPLGDKRWPF